MANITTACAKCRNSFLIIEHEQKFLRDKNLSLPNFCPSCRQTRRLMLRGGRQLFRTECQKCGKNIITSYNPKSVSSAILCKEDYDKYWLENDPIIKEPLPEE